jgi:uncharacterized protein (DUF342 family)
MTTAQLPPYLKPVIEPGNLLALVLLVEPHNLSKLPLHEQVVLDRPSIDEVVKENGADGWFVDETEISRFLREQNDNFTVSKGYRFAEQRDACVEIQVSSDRLTACVTLRPPLGGKKVSVDMIAGALRQAGVSYGVLKDQIPDLVAAEVCENVLIAKGLPPEPGNEVSFDELVDEIENAGHPQERADGRVDYHEIGLIRSVVKGTPLIRRTPPTPGAPGVGVDGLPIAPVPGKDMALTPGTGAEISADDPNLLLAATGGEPVLLGHTAKVVAKLELDGVNFQTGNVDFDGSVVVRGPILPGFKIKAGGDILAYEEVDGAELQAGGSIELRQGIFGKHNCRLAAKGHVKARFLNDCIVDCEGNLEVRDLLARCAVVCEGKLIAGKDGGKGQVLGGTAIATKGVEVKILGCQTEVATVVEVSTSPKLVSQHQQHAKEIFRVERNLDEIQRSLAYLRKQANARSDGRIDKLSEAYFTLSEQLETFRSEAQDLSERVKAKVEGKIVAQEVYGGVTLKIGPHHRRITSFVKMLEFEAPAEELEAVACSDTGSDVCLDSDREAWLGVGQTP